MVLEEERVAVNFLLVCGPCWITLWEVFLDFILTCFVVSGPTCLGWSNHHFSRCRRWRCLSGRWVGFGLRKSPQGGGLGGSKEIRKVKQRATEQSSKNTDTANIEVTLAPPSNYQQCELKKSPMPGIVVHAFNQHLGGRGSHSSASLRPAWSTYEFQF